MTARTNGEFPTGLRENTAICNAFEKTAHIWWGKKILKSYIL